MTNRSAAFAVRTALTSAAFTAVLWSAVAHADSAPAPDSTPDSVSASPDIVVTATRKETKLQQTPVAVSVFGSGDIALKQFTTARDLAGQAPGVLIPQAGITPSTQIFYIRGIGDSDPIFDPAVAVYVDDVYLPRAINGLTDLTDIQRVEVLRGPQGTLFGENAGAGAIRYVTRTPTDHTEASADIGYGSYDTFQGHAFISGALKPGLADASIAIAHDEHGGYTWDPTLNTHVNNQNTTGGRAKLLVTPDPSLKLLFSGDYTVDHSATDYYTPVEPIVGGTLKNPVYGSYVENVSYAAQTPLNHSWNGGGSFKASYDFDSHLTLNAISALRAFAQNPVNYNNDGQPLVTYSAAVPTTVAISDNYIVYKEHEFTQELQLQGHYDRFDFTGGLYYLFENFSSNRIGYVVSATAASANPAFPEDQIGDTRTTNYAAYAQGNYKLTDQLLVTLGGRYTNERRKFTFAGVFDHLDGSPITPVTGAPASTAGGYAAAYNFTYYGNKDWHSFTPKVGLSEQLTSDVFLYASYSQGFDAGGFNNRAASLAAALPYDQEDVIAWEAGIKSDWLERRLRFNLTGFYNKYNNLQQTASVISPVTGGFVSVRSNAGHAHTEGFELETSVQPVNGLVLGGNASYLVTRFDDFPNAATTVVNGVTELVGATGNQLPFAPRWQLSGSADYTIKLDDAGTVRLGGTVTHESSYYSDVFNYAKGQIGDQSYINAYVSYALPGDHWRLTLTGHNLANHIAYQSLTWGGTPSLWYGPQSPPRTVFFKAAYTF